MNVFGYAYVLFILFSLRTWDLKPPLVGREKAENFYHQNRSAALLWQSSNNTLIIEGSK